MPDSLNNAALVLKSLPKSEAANLMSKLDVQDVRAIMQRSDKIGERTEQDLFKALNQLVVEANAIRKKIRPANLQSKPKQKPSPQDNTSPPDGNPFKFLRGLPVEVQVDLLKDEHPDNIALIVAYMPTELSTQILKHVDEPTRMSVFRRLCYSIDHDKQHVSQLVASLKKRLRRSLDRDDSVGVERAGQLLSCSDGDAQAAVLNHLNQTDPQLANDIRSSLTRFEDLRALEDLDIQILLKNIDTSWWAPALKAASNELQERVLTNMAKPVAAILSSEIASIQNADDPRCQPAQLRIIKACFQLAEQGKIKLPPKADSSQIA